MIRGSSSLGRPIRRHLHVKTKHISARRPGRRRRRRAAGRGDLGLTSDGDDSTSGDRGERAGAPITPGSPTPPTGPGGRRRRAVGHRGGGRGIRSSLARRRPVRAPDFSAQVIHAGTPRLAPASRSSAPPARDSSTSRSCAARRSCCISGPPSARPAAATRAWSRRPGSVGAARRAVRRRERERVRRRGPRGDRASTTSPIRRLRSQRRGRRALRRHALPQTFFISAGGDIVGRGRGQPVGAAARARGSAAESGTPVRQRAGQQPRAAAADRARSL